MPCRPEKGRQGDPPSSILLSASHASKIIQRAGDLSAHGFGEVSINLRRAHIRMAEELLDAADVHPTQHEVGGKGAERRRQPRDRLRRRSSPGAQRKGEGAGGGD